MKDRKETIQIYVIIWLNATLMVFYVIMTDKKATAVLAVIVVIASLMIGASVIVALISEGVGIQQAKAAPPKRILTCSEHSPPPGSPPPCGPSLRAR
jgi:hypothetical protein